jgi:DnaJ-class molecular chaperone
MSEQQMCPVCSGKGGRDVFACPGFRQTWATCSACGGTGQISAQRAHLIEIGNAHYEGRVQRRVSSRDEAARLGVDAMELSKFEHQGILTDRLAQALGLAHEDGAP